MDNKAFNEALESLSHLDEYAQYIVEIETQFYSVDNDAEALRLSLEAKKKGHSHSMFDYVIGFCYRNGKGGVQQDKRIAGQYFFASAEAKDNNGSYYNEKHSDESRAILAEDFVLHDNEYGIIDVRKAIEYCKVLLNHNSSVDDALLYLTFIYGQPDFGCMDVETAITYCDRLLQTTDPDHKAKATSIRQALENLRPKPKKSLFGFFGKR